MFGYNRRYATIEDLNEVTHIVKENEKCLQKLEQSILKIEAGIGLIKWFIATAITLVPILSTILSSIYEYNTRPTNGTPTEIILTLPPRDVGGFLLLSDRVCLDSERTLSPRPDSPPQAIQLS